MAHGKGRRPSTAALALTFVESSAARLRAGLPIPCVNGRGVHWLQVVGGAVTVVNGERVEDGLPAVGAADEVLSSGGRWRSACKTPLPLPQGDPTMKYPFFRPKTVFSGPTWLIPSDFVFKTACFGANSSAITLAAPPPSGLAAAFRDNSNAAGFKARRTC